MKTTQVKCLLVGFGYWGPNLARSIFLEPRCELIGIVEIDGNQRQAAKTLYSVPVVEDIAEFHPNNVDLAVITTPPETHFEIASYFIKFGINVLLAKPVGVSSNQATQLQKLAAKFNVNLFCDFTYLYNDNIKFLLNYAEKNPLEVLQYTSFRSSLGIIQRKVNVLKDLLIHDISILIALKKVQPSYARFLSTNEANSNQQNYPHEAAVVLRWNDDFSAFVFVSWNSPLKVRQIQLKGSSQALVIQELIPTHPIQIIHFSPRFSVSEPSEDLKTRTLRNISYTLGDVETPLIVNKEALRNEISEIVDFLQEPAFERPTLSPINIDFAVKVWKTLDLIENSHVY